jgi:hypothetical protein
MICDLNFICVVIQASNTTDFKFESMERKKKLCHGQCIEIATMFFTFSLFSAFSLAMDSFAYLLLFSCAIYK